MQETWVQSLGQEDPLEKGMNARSSILAWRIPWTEEPGRLQPTGFSESDTTKQFSRCCKTYFQSLLHSAYVNLPAKTKENIFKSESIKYLNLAGFVNLAIFSSFIRLENVLRNIITSFYNSGFRRKYQPRTLSKKVYCSEICMETVSRFSMQPFVLNVLFFPDLRSSYQTTVS